MESLFTSIIIGYFLYEVVRSLKSVFFAVSEKIKERRKNTGIPFTDNEIQEAFENKIFGDFKLSNAVVFFKNQNVVPKEGFRIFTNDETAESGIKQVLISVSAEKIFDIFDELLKTLGDTFHFVVDDFRSENGEYSGNYGYNKDAFIVRSLLIDYEDLVVNNGFVAFAAFNPELQTEVHLLREKVISVVTKDIYRFVSVLIDNEIDEKSDLGFVWDGNYLLFSQQAEEELFDPLISALNVDEVIVFPENKEK